MESRARQRPKAITGFVELECNDDLAARLRREIEVAAGKGYDGFEFNLFDVELFYAEDRVRVAENTALGYEESEVSIEEFLAAIPAVPPGPRMYERPRRVIIPPPPPE